MSRVSRHTCPFPSVLPPRGPPCKHWPHFRMSLKLRSSTVFAVGVWVKPAEDEAGGHWENPPEPALRTHALPCSALCWQILLSPWCLAPGNSEGQALGLDCLLLASEGRMMCVSTLDLEHPEEKYSLVRVFFFFFTRGSASQSGPRFHSDAETLSFPDAGKLTATVTGDVALDDPQQRSEEGARHSSGLSRGLASSRVSYEPQSTVTRQHHHLSAPFLVEESEVQS